MSLPPFQRLLDEHAADVHRFLVASVGREEAEDCFQETWIAALRAYPRLRDARNLRGWLLTIAHRKALDAHRARARRPLPAETAAGVAAAQPAPPAPERDDAVWAAVRALPPKQRAAVALRFAGDLAYAEVGAALDCTPEAARRSVHEGLAKLKEAL